MVKVWTYGNAGDRWPVAPGDVWKAGEHVLACGDIENGAGEELVRTHGVPDLVYTDPPWTPALATGFRTKAGVPRQVDFEGLLERLVSVVSSCALGPVFIEMGLRWADRLSGMVQAAGGWEVRRWPITYYRTKPAVLLLFSFGWDAPCDRLDFTGLDDEHTPMAALDYYGYEGALVLDPFAGRGLTSEAANNKGCRFLGLELHPRRLAVALAMLAECGLPPIKIGNLQRS